MTPAQVRAIRKALGLTQGELAEALGYAGGKVCVCRIEHGTRNLGGPAEAMLRRLAKDAGVGVDTKEVT